MIPAYSYSILKTINLPPVKILSDELHANKYDRAIIFSSIEKDWLEAIIALPEQIFYNTGIATNVWIVSNRKNDNLKKGPVRIGKVQLVNGVDFNYI